MCPSGQVSTKKKDLTVNEYKINIIMQTRSAPVRQSMTIKEVEFENITDFMYVGTNCQGVETRLVMKLTKE